jgi:hypothetical protein
MVVNRSQRGAIEIGPGGRDQRPASIRQDEDKIQMPLSMGVTENEQRLAGERMMRTGDRHSLRKVLMMGSVW